VAVETLQKLVVKMIFAAHQLRMVTWTPWMQKVEVAGLVCQTLLLVDSGGREGCHAGRYGRHLTHDDSHFESDRADHLYRLAAVWLALARTHEAVWRAPVPRYHLSPHQGCCAPGALDHPHWRVWTVAIHQAVVVEAREVAHH